MNKVTIVVPIYNVEKYIYKNIQSIVNQSYKDFNVILVDDGSLDNSSQIAEELLKTNNINYKIIRQNNRGLSGARNSGLKSCKTKYVVFVDSDDILHKDFLLELVSSMESNDCDISIANYKFIKKQNEVFGENKGEKLIFEKKDMLDIFLKRTLQFVLPSMIFKTDILKNNSLFFSELVNFSEDQLFIWESIFLSKKICYLTRELYGYYIRPNSIMTSTSNKKIIDSHRIIKEKYDYFYKTYNYDSFKYALPRWELGALYTSSKILNYKQFVEVFIEFDGKTISKRLNGFKEPKAKVLSKILRFSKRFFYIICRRII